MHIGTIYEICTRIRITVDAQNKQHLSFRAHHSLLKRQHFNKVPFVKGQTGAPEDRYYFCNNYFIPLPLYLPYLEATKDMSDTEVLKATDETLEIDGQILSYKLQAWRNKKSSPYTASMTNSMLDQCIMKMHLGGRSNKDIADLLGVGDRRVRNVIPKQAHEVEGVRGNTETREERKAALRTGFRSTLVPKELKDAPEYGAISKAANYARIRAHGMGVPSTFLVADVVPTMYDIQGNSGRHNGILIVPKVCPVLRIPLDYNVFENKKALNKVRVWRKTPGPDGTAPLTPDNVIVMSTIAAWAIEGAYGTNKLKDLTYDMQMALKEWQDKHGTRTVPREKKIGRPRKAA